MIIGKKMKELMKKQNISQRDLSIRLNTTEATISRYINNQREPNTDTLANIATALNTTVDYLLGKSSDDDIDCGFGKLKVFVARNATNLTQDQKLEIINILLKNKDNF